MPGAQLPGYLTVSFLSLHIFTLGFLFFFSFFLSASVISRDIRRPKHIQITTGTVNRTFWVVSSCFSFAFPLLGYNKTGGWCRAHRIVCRVAWIQHNVLFYILCRCYCCGSCYLCNSGFV